MAFPWLTRSRLTRLPSPTIPQQNIPPAASFNRWVYAQHLCYAGRRGEEAATGRCLAGSVIHVFGTCVGHSCIRHVCYLPRRHGHSTSLSTLSFHQQFGLCLFYFITIFDIPPISRNSLLIVQASEVFNFILMSSWLLISRLFSCIKCLFWLHRDDFCLFMKLLMKLSPVHMLLFPAHLGFPPN